MKPQRAILKVAEETQKAPPQAEPRKSFWQYLTGGIKRMANGEEKTIASIPFPVFVWLMGITIAAVYAFASLNSTVAAMNSAMLVRDAQYAREREADEKRNQEERRKLETQIESQQAYINQLRVEMARKGK